MCCFSSSFGALNGAVRAASISSSVSRNFCTQIVSREVVSASFSLIVGIGLKRGLIVLLYLQISMIFQSKKMLNHRRKQDKKSTALRREVEQQRRQEQLAKIAADEPEEQRRDPRLRAATKAASYKLATSIGSRRRERRASGPDEVPSGKKIVWQTGIDFFTNFLLFITIDG
jgi:hypothetical protein